MLKRFLLSVTFLWLVSMPLSAIATNPQNPMLDNESIYLSKQGLHRFDSNSLELEWSSLVGIETFEPVMGDKLIYIGSTQGLYALNPVNGDIVWHIEALHTLFSPTVDGQVYAGSLHGEIYAINSDSGTIHWRRQFPGWIYSPLILADLGKLWIGGQTHEALALDINNGRILHRVRLDQESIFSPQLVDSELIIYNLFSGNSFVIDAHSATTIGLLDGSSQPRHVSIDLNTIYRTSRDGSLIAFNKNTLRTIWRQHIVEHDLSMHPVSQGFMLLSDLDQTMILFDLESHTEIFRKKIKGTWFSPIQIDDHHIIYFLSETLQPNKIRAVKLDARDT